MLPLTRVQFWGNPIFDNHSPISFGRRAEVALLEHQLKDAREALPKAGRLAFGLPEIFGPFGRSLFGGLWASFLRFSILSGKTPTQ